MNKIKILPDNLANQIAAGEVVERPASVIKELVENAIDAGASRITIDVELGGRRLMRIADDGQGMSRDDAVLAFERHATSKIRDLGDLSRIGTLGFRGEALASIASVAKVELVTKPESENAATLVHIEGGRLLDVKDAPRDLGTTIAVRDLFFNTPARRKFMRSEATENYHIASIVTHYALANPAISFTLTSNGREVLRTSPANGLRERAFQIFGGNLLDSLLPVGGGREYVANVHGFVSAPRERRTSRDSQYFFVNGRFVRDKVISDGLREGYRSVLPHGFHPVAFLFLDIPVEEVDVNVHPAKTEVRFRRSEAIKDAIAEAVRDSLAKGGVAIRQDSADEPSFESQIAEAGTPDAFSPPQTEPVLEEVPSEQAAEAAAGTHAPGGQVAAPLEQRDKEIPPGLFSAEPFSGTEISAEFERFARARQQQLDASSEATPTSASPTAAYPVLPPIDSAVRFVKEVEVDSVSRSTIRPLAQLHESYIIAVDEEGLLLIDQHVAHERILFDKFRNREAGRNIESQNLLLPETIDLSPSQTTALGLVEDELASLGFGLMSLSGRTVAIRSIPTDVPAADVRNLFSEILDSVDLAKAGNAKSAIRDDIAASLACRAAVKVNMPLTEEKMQWLIDRLLTTSSPTTCPHGRPVILRLAMKDIERGFHRI